MKCCARVHLGPFIFNIYLNASLLVNLVRLALFFFHICQFHWRSSVCASLIFICGDASIHSMHHTIYFLFALLSIHKYLSCCHVYFFFVCRFICFICRSNCVKINTSTPMRCEQTITKWMTKRLDGTAFSSVNIYLNNYIISRNGSGVFQTPPDVSDSANLHCQLDLIWFDDCLAVSSQKYRFNYTEFAEIVFKFQNFQ